MNESNTYCRICGSFKLNKFHFALDLSNKINIYQLLRRDGSLDELIRPCECRGEFAFAHKVCLANWIETTKHEYCDVCRFKYNVKVVDKSIFDWIFETQQIEKGLKMSCLALLVYYLSGLGILVATQNSLLDVAIKASAYIWIAMCSVFMTGFWYRELLEFFEWRANHKRVEVEANKHPQLDSVTKPKDVLKSSGFRPHDRESARAKLVEISETN